MPLAVGQASDLCVKVQQNLQEDGIEAAVVGC